ncbi:class I SAM-dependent methyltransferase [Metapseudomonas boanensis]|uniref:Class I SAM-dependent methyltransferase n=1 Tax=Metapseudomonas boanensis TaxID=2822138 RepID=A0ABS5XIH6_9GAMM|nr:class I SAM-dependent methyltransferase [Pseudomonas boanensis]MBT8767479.1 class I SAM-dependent methyltransferase [Pseudomonas boanensis]
MHHISCIKLHEETDSGVYLSLLTAVGAALPESRHRDLLMRLSPHLLRAARMSKRFENLELEVAKRDLRLDRHQTPVSLLSDDGRLVFCNREAEKRLAEPAARALRCRRRIIARALDDTCAQPGKQARVLCIAGGHFREVELSRALRHGQFAEMCVFDDDETCLATVRRSYGALGVTTLQGTLEQLLAGQFEFDGFDLVYSAGLCELLDDRTCERLAQRLFHAVKPGGRLLLGNMRPGISAIGFLEGLLDWHPHYRQDSRMLGLLDGIDCNEIASARVFHDVGQRVVFLEAVRYG